MLLSLESDCSLTCLHLSTASAIDVWPAYEAYVAELVLQLTGIEGILELLPFNKGFVATGDVMATKVTRELGNTTDPLSSQRSAQIKAVEIVKNTDFIP